MKTLYIRLRVFQYTKEPVNLRFAFAALTLDVITGYCFANSHDCLKPHDFAPQWIKVVDASSQQCHINKQFGWLLPLLKKLPVRLVAKLNLQSMLNIDFQEVREV